MLEARERERSVEVEGVVGSAAAVGSGLGLKGGEPGNGAEPVKEAVVGLEVEGGEADGEDGGPGEEGGGGEREGGDQEALEGEVEGFGDLDLDPPELEGGPDADEEGGLGAKVGGEEGERKGVGGGDVGEEEGDLGEVEGEQGAEEVAGLEAEGVEGVGDLEVQGESREDDGAVAGQIAPVDRDGLALENVSGEGGIRHVGPPPGDVNGEEPGFGDGQTGEVAVGVGDLLAGLLGEVNSDKSKFGAQESGKQESGKMGSEVYSGAIWTGSPVSDDVLATTGSLGDGLSERRWRLRDVGGRGGGQGLKSCDEFGLGLSWGSGPMGVGQWAIGLKGEEVYQWYPANLKMGIGSEFRHLAAIT